MPWDNEGKNHSGETKKSELLPTGEKSKAIVEVLAAMFRDTNNLDDPADDDVGEKDACPDEDGKEQSR